MSSRFEPQDPSAALLARQLEDAHVQNSGRQERIRVLEGIISDTIRQLRSIPGRYQVTDSNGARVARLLHGDIYRAATYLQERLERGDGS